MLRGNTIKRVTSFERAGGELINIVSRKNNAFFLALWHDLVNSTPVLTGTARYSWILTAGNPSPRKPIKQIWPIPPEPDVWRYTWRWMNWYIVNNQEYVHGLNTGANPTKKANPGWIESAIRRTIDRQLRGDF